MDSVEQVFERRKDKRYVMNGNTYTFLRSPVNKIGKLIDISMSGLSFTYFSANGASFESNGLDILADGEICLEDIPYTTVNDFIFPNEQPFYQITVRRRGVKFEKLTEEQAEYIQALIDKFGNAEDEIEM